MGWFGKGKGEAEGQNEKDRAGIERNPASPFPIKKGPQNWAHRPGERTHGPQGPEGETLGVRG